MWLKHKQKLEEVLTTTYRKWLDQNELNKNNEIVFIPTNTTEDYRTKYMQLQLKVSTKFFMKINK